MGGENDSVQGEFNIEALRRPSDLKLPRNIQVSRTTDYPPARRVFYDIAENRREHYFRIGVPREIIGVSLD